MNNSMPVVYIITKLELGGAQKICLSLFKEIEAQGSSTYLITGDEGTIIHEVKAKPNVFLLKSLKRELMLHTFGREIISFFSMIRILRQLKKKHPTIVLHTHGSKAGILGRFAGFCAGIKTRIHTIHGFPFHSHQKMIAWLAAYCAEFIAAPFTTHYICVSRADCTTGARLLPGFRKKHSLIRAAVDTDYFFVPALEVKPHPSTYEPFVFGTISCMKPQKNLVDMLRAFALVYKQNPRVRLEIIGDGIERKAIETWIFKHHLDEVITLHGWQEDVLPFLKSWHTFVLSSLWEGLPCALIEARLARLPVLCYDTGGIREIIHHGVNGFVYPQREFKNLAQGMFALSSDELLFTTLRNYPDNFKEFDLGTMIAKHAKLYQTIRL